MPDQPPLSPLVHNAVSALVAVLDSLTIRYALLGGVAVQFWGHLRFTMDVDLVLALSGIPEDAFLARMQQSGFQRDPLRGVIRIDDFVFSVFQFSDKPGGFEIRVDVYHSSTEFQDEVIRRARRGDYEGIPVSMASAEDLILFKLLAARPVDQMDIVHLIRLRENELDMDYLRLWASRLNCESALDEALHNAKTWPDT